MEKKCKKVKWLSREALQIAVERREAKSKGEKERYKHLNAEFQRIARRDNEPFLSNQYKEIEENNRMGKTRDLFKKTRDIKGIFHAKMGSIKDRNGMKYSLDISNFLKEISSLSHSLVFLYFFALTTEEGFPISPCCSLELCIQMGISFLFILVSYASSPQIN